MPWIILTVFVFAWGTQGFKSMFDTRPALDPQTGAVLALVSKPSFDPNLFVNGIPSATYRALLNSPEFLFQF